MRKFLILLLCILIIVPMSSTVYSTTGTKDTVTIGPYSGEYKTLEAALADVKDGGIIYIKPKLVLREPYLFNNVVIDKNITIEGYNPNNRGFPIIGWGNSTPEEKTEPLITVNSPYTLYMKNLIFKSLPEKVIIQSNTSNLSLENVQFAHSYPLIINNSTDNGELNININNCKFDVYPMKIQLEEGSTGNITLTNNVFRNIPTTISNNGASIHISDNTFVNSGLNISDVGLRNIDITNNVFEGNITSISTSASDNLNISYNSFNANIIVVKNTNAELPLDLRYNWWGSIEDPLTRADYFYVTGEIDYSNWSLDENFSSFNGELGESNGCISGTAFLQNSVRNEDIEVSLLNGSRLIYNASTDSSGHFEFTDIDYGTYDLCFAYENFNTVTEEVYLATESVSIDAVLHYNIEYVDVNSDGSITELDLQRLADSYGYDMDSYDWNSRFDLNKNDMIDIFDMIILFRFKEEF